MTDQENPPSPTIVMPRFPVDLGPISGDQLPTSEARRVLTALEAQRERFENASIAENTRIAYYSDLLDFFWWCQRHHLTPLPADEETVLAYITACAAQRPFLSRRNQRLRLIQRTLRYSSIERRLAAIRFLHRHAGEEHTHCSREHPATERLLNGIARQLGRRPRGKKGFSLEQIQAMVQWIRQRSHRTYSPELQDELNYRDEALLLTACASGRRRSELAALNVSDLTFDETGVEVLVRRSKTDQEALGQTLYMSSLDSQYCPVRALKQHLGRRKLGPVFMRLDHAAKRSIYTGNAPRIHPRTIANVFKRCAEGIGLDARLYAAHSSRKTMATLASRAGADLANIKSTGGWKSSSGVGPYIEAGNLKKNSITGKVLG